MRNLFLFTSQHSAFESAGSAQTPCKARKSKKSLPTKQVEKLFRQQIKEHQLYSIRLILIKVTIILIIFLISLLLKSEKDRGTSSIFLIVCFAINAVYGIMFTFFQNRLKKYVEYLAGFYLGGFSLIIVEIFRQDIEQFDAMRIFSGGVFILYAFSLCLLSKLNWKICLLILFIVNSFIFGRLNILLSDKVGYNIQITIVLTDLFLFFTLMAYKLERAEFNHFLSFHNNLHEIKAYKRLLEEEIPNHMVIFKSDDVRRKEQVVLANRACKRFFGTENEEVIMESLKKLVLISFEKEPTELGNLIYNEEIFDAVKEEFQSFNVELKCEAGNVCVAGSKTKLDLKLGRLRDNKDEPVWVVIMSDISLVDRIEEMQNLQDKKDQMLATVSHDFRTPVIGIINLLELALEEPGEGSALEKRNKYLRIAIDAAQSLLFLVNDILDIAQISKGKLKSLIKEPTPVGPLINRIIGLLSFTARKKGIELISKMNFLEEELILVDQNRFQQILVNLLGNAIKFTEAGSVTISLTSATYLLEQEDKCFAAGNRRISISDPSSGTTRCVVLHVEDTGIGIKEKDLGNLFQPFGKMEIERNKQGVGLGLSISQTLVKLMTPKLIEGGIKVKSKEGKGSHFWFPVEIANREPSPSLLSFTLSSLEEGEKPLIVKNSISEKIVSRNDLMTSSRPCLKSKPAKKKVLIADDDPINLLVLKRMLEKVAGLEYEFAVNGKEAVQKLEAGWNKGCDYPLIIMDLNMPIMNGQEAAGVIYKASLEKFSSVPEIIILTAGDGDLINNKHRKHINQVIMKPLTFKRLNELLDSFYFF